MDKKQLERNPGSLEELHAKNALVLITASFRDSLTYLAGTQLQPLPLSQPLLPSPSTSATSSHPQAHTRGGSKLDRQHMCSASEVHIPQVTAMLSFVLPTQEKIPSVYGYDSVSTCKILSSNPRIIFHSILSSIQRLVETEGPSCFQV